MRITPTPAQIIIRREDACNLPLMKIDNQKHKMVLSVLLQVCLDMHSLSW